MSVKEPDKTMLLEILSELKFETTVHEFDKKYHGQFVKIMPKVDTKESLQQVLNLSVFDFGGSCSSPPISSIFFELTSKSISNVKCPVFLTSFVLAKFSEGVFTFPA